METYFISRFHAFGFYLSPRKHQFLMFSGVIKRNHRYEMHNFQKIFWKQSISLFFNVIFLEYLCMVLVLTDPIIILESLLKNSLKKLFHSENDTNRLSDPQVSFEFIWRRSKGWVFTLISLNKFVIGWYIESFTC